MVNINLNKQDESMIPGVHLWRIKHCTEKRSNNGNHMLDVKFEREDNPDVSIYDTVMLEGKGFHAFGKSKLAAALGDGFEGDLDPNSLIGERFWLATKLEAYTNDKGVTRESLKVDVDRLSHKGWQPWGDTPPGCEPAEPPIEAPF